LKKIKKWLFTKKEAILFSLRVQFIVIIGLAIVIAAIGVYGAGKVSWIFIERELMKDISSLSGELVESKEMVKQYIRSHQMSEEEVDQIESELNTSERLVFSIIQADLDVDQEDFKISIEDYVSTGLVVDREFYVNAHGQYALLIETKQAINALTILIIVLVILYIVLFLLIFTFFVGRKEKYLRNIAEGVDHLAQGDLDYRIKERGMDEIHFVAKNINLMSIALKEQIEKERKSEESKNQLIANVSHDLRTPLTSVTGFLSLIQDNPNMDEDLKARYIETALTKAMALSELIDQLFEYITVSNITQEVQMEAVNMKLYVDQMLFEYGCLLKEKGFTIQMERQEVLELQCLINPEMMNRVFDNLFANIIKHGLKDEPIKVHIHKRKDYYYICMINGVSLESGESVQENVFNRYFTTDRNYNESGGLGLTIVKEIIQKHRGMIEASNDGRFFTIEFGIPIIE